MDGTTVRQHDITKHERLGTDCLLFNVLVQEDSSKMIARRGLQIWKDYSQHPSANEGSLCSLGTDTFAFSGIAAQGTDCLFYF